MSDMVHTQIELPRDVFELLKQREEAHGITATQQIVEVLTAYLKGEADPVLQADDPILRVVAAMGSSVGDLSTNHDRYLYRKDWQERVQAKVSE
jgi:plasmid stability protein